MRIVPVLFPCDLGSTAKGVYTSTGERDAPDLILDMMEGEGVRLARPAMVPVPPPVDVVDAEDAPLKLDTYIAAAVRALAEVVEGVNNDGDFPIILGGDHLAMCGQILAAGQRDGGIGLAVLADAQLDLATPAPPAFDDKTKLKDAAYTWDGDADRMVLAAALRMFDDSTEFGRTMASSALNAKQTSVMGVRAPSCAQVKKNERAANIDVWTMERFELDGEASYRSSLSRHLEMGPIVLSIDVSGLDPHLMTAVRRPVSDGIDWAFLKRSLDQCAPHVDRLLGLDISQIDPSLDDVHHSATQRLVETLAPFFRRLRR